MIPNLLRERKENINFDLRFHKKYILYLKINIIKSLKWIRTGQLTLKLGQSTQKLGQNILKKTGQQI
jgi:hypothetical protein